jgi:outer membrane autotransporter protein
MAGPYTAVRLSDRLFFQARAAWGTSENEVSPFLTYTDRFDSRRWLVSSTLTGTYEKNSWMFRPSASFAYIEDESDAYVDGLGVTIPSVRTALGQFRAEPEVSYAYTMSSGTILEPKIGAAVIWNFESNGTAAGFGGTLAGPEETRGKVNAGVATRFVGGAIVDIEASYDGLGSEEYHAAAGRVTVRVPLN